MLCSCSTVLVVYAAAWDEASPQYNVVLKKLEVLTERLQRAKEVETLLQKFKMEKWIADGATATANELVLLALDRIKNQVTDYDVFIKMLRSMPGVKSIADQMTGMYVHMCVHDVHVHTYIVVPLLHFIKFVDHISGLSLISMRL